MARGRSTPLAIAACSTLWTLAAGTGPSGVRRTQHEARGVDHRPSTRGHRPPTAGVVRADSFWSQALGIRKQYVIYLPPSYESEPARRYPVAFYLHGLWGDEWDWARLGRLNAALDSLLAAPRGARRAAREIIVVMPDGDDGWYTTWNTLFTVADCRRKPMRQDESPATYCVPWPHYDDYIARDLVAHIDSTYRTIADRAHRGIAGLSMGGYGAVTLALAYPDVFAAAASHSGVLSPLYAGPHPFAPPPRYAAGMDTIRARAGALWPSMRLAFGADTAAWFARDPARLARRLVRSGRTAPALYLDVGRDDPFLDQGRAFHAELLALGVAHRYAERPGKHDWSYWRSHVGESLAWLMSVIGD